MYQEPPPPRTNIAAGKAAAEWKQNVASTYTGMGMGKVRLVETKKNVGVIVTIEYVDKGVTWGLRTMHHREALVKEGEVVRPGQIYARGAGHGDQFTTPDAGPAHVHVELYKNGQLVHLVNGAPVAWKPPPGGAQ
jgi:murein DD-endopeptidase MepM/ murein hydrolase activator NlpD